jgi:trk system potassium uptake protein TrkA
VEEPVHFVIMGCGRVGSSLANDLDAMGHSVAVIDQAADSFRRLSHSYGGTKVVGVGFDRDRLTEAGIERAEAFAAVSNGDNSNILAARVARENFGVERVVARIYDPKRAEVYQRLGIPTVATVSWTAVQMLRRLLPEGSQEDWRDPTGTVSLAEVHVDSGWIGERAKAIAEQAGSRLAFITRYGQAMLPDDGTVLQEDDLMHVLFRAQDRGRVEEFLGKPPEGR